jgi:hypothetical protein
LVSKLGAKKLNVPKISFTTANTMWFFVIITVITLVFSTLISFSLTTWLFEDCRWSLQTMV